MVEQESRNPQRASKLLLNLAILPVSQEAGQAYFHDQVKGMIPVGRYQLRVFLGTINSATNRTLLLYRTDARLAEHKPNRIMSRGALTPQRNLTGRRKRFASWLPPGDNARAAESSADNGTAALRSSWPRTFKNSRALFLRVR